MRQTRYEVEMVEHHKPIQQLVCDECGALEDVVALSRPEGWITLYQTLEHGSESKDFCSWPCLYSEIERRRK